MSGMTIRAAIVLRSIAIATTQRTSWLVNDGDEQHDAEEDEDEQVDQDAVEETEAMVEVMAMDWIQQMVAWWSDSMLAAMQR